jgi:hypothetical protein
MSQPLAETIFWIAAVACVVAQAALLRFTFASSPAKQSELVPSAPRAGEIAWAIIPALVLVLLFGATWRRIGARHAHMTMDHGAMEHSMQMPPTSGR